MCGINMVIDNLCRIRSNGSDSYSYDKYIIFQLKYGHFPISSIFGLCVAPKNHVYRSGNWDNAEILFIARDSACISHKIKVKHFFFNWYFISIQGAVPKGNATKEMIQQMGFRDGQVIFKCPKCCSIKPDRAHHCSVCQRLDLIELIYLYLLMSRTMYRSHCAAIADVSGKWIIIVHGLTIV